MPSVRRQRLSDARLAFIVSAVIFFLGFSLGWCVKARAAEFGCYEHHLRGVKGKCLQDITFAELESYLMKVEASSNPMQDMIEKSLNKKAK